MREQSEVGTKLMSRLAETGERGYDLRVDLSGISLTGDRFDRIEAHFLSDQPIEFANLGVIAAEKLQKTCLCSRSSLRTAKAQAVDPMLDFVQIEHEVITPKRRPLADGRKLRR